MMTTFDLISLASEKVRFAKSLVHALQNCFLRRNLEPYKLQKRFDDRYGVANVVGHESFQTRRPRFDS